MSESTKQVDVSRREVWIGAAVAIAVLVLSALYAWWAWPRTHSPNEFGDAFGALNTVFSGLAFAGLIAALFMQSRQLELQRQELRETKEELARSAEANEAAVKLAAMQIQIAHQARVVVYVVPPTSREGRWSLVVANTGATIAKNVVVSIIGDLTILKPSQRKEGIPVEKKAVPVLRGDPFQLPPQHALAYRVADGQDFGPQTVIGPRLSAGLIATATYELFDGSTKSEPFLLSTDFAEYTVAPP